MDGTGPAIGLLPGSGSTAHRSMIATAVVPEAPVPAQVAVVVATSGSTGNPAGVLLPGSSLRAAACGFAERAGQPEGHRWVATLPLHHAGGLMVAVRSVVAGTSPVAVASLGGGSAFSVEAFAAATAHALELSAQDARPLAVSLVPPMLTMLDAAGADGWDLLAEYDAVLVGGAADHQDPRGSPPVRRGAPLHVLRDDRDVWRSGLRRSGPWTGYEWKWQPDGRLAIVGDQVALGYRDGRDAHRWTIDPHGQRRFLTDDLGEVGTHGLVLIDGRADDVVQVGGVIGLPQRSPRDSSRPIPGSSPPRWWPSPIPSGAAVSWPLWSLPIRRAPPRRRSSATSWSSRDLGTDAARPRVIHPVDALPMLESGKVDRLAVLAWASDLDRITR